MLSDRNIVQYSQHFQTYILHLPVLSNSHRSPGIEPPWPDQGHKSIPESVTVDLGTECADGHSGSCADPRSWPPAGRGGWGHHAHRLSPASLSPTQTWALGTRAGREWSCWLSSAWDAGPRWQAAPFLISCLCSVLIRLAFRIL